MIQSTKNIFSCKNGVLICNPNDREMSLQPPQAYNNLINGYSETEEIYADMMAPTKVKLGYDKENDRQVVIKSIYKNLLYDDLARQQAAIEFPLQCSLNHMNIVKGYEYAESDNEHIIVMEYVNKAEYLKEKIDDDLNQIKNEVKLKSFMADLFEAVAYLHECGVAHCDIKLENILTKKNEYERIPTLKLCDFGLSQLINPDTGTVIIDKMMGTHGYIAPEIRDGVEITDAVDIWSLGIVFYKLCVAYKPTQVGGYKYGSGPIPFRKFDWKKRSPELIDLLKRMLEFEGKNRITANEALDHPWFHIEGFN